MQDPKQRLRELFEREQRRPRQAVVQALDSLQLRNGDRIADVGCGPGANLRHMLERVAPEGEVVGIDTNPERLEVASTMLQDEIGRGSIRLVEADMHALDPGIAGFDVAWMSLVIHHEDVPVETIRALRDIVVPGGRIAILDGDDAASFPFLPWPPGFELTIREAVARAAGENGGEWRFGKRYASRSLLTDLQEAGLSNVQLRAFSDVRHAPVDEWDVTDIQNWLLNSFGSRIRDYLTPADWRRYESHFTPGTPAYILDRPGFFLIRTWFLGVGTVTTSEKPARES